MSSLDPNNDLFKKLANNPPAWWKAIAKDKDISVQIRKDSTIDVYFNCGAIITGLQYSRQGFSGKISAPYIPLNKKYYSYEFTPESIEFPSDKLKPLLLNNFNDKTLQNIKSRIKQYFPNSSEKGIQASFIKNDPYFIDMEYEYGHDLRMDLIRLDFRLEKIVFVELKLVGNKEIYKNDIVEQLCKYHKYIASQRAQLIEYYKKVFHIKKIIGVLPKDLLSKDVGGFDILDKPLLLFGDCEQAWIDEFSPVLDNKIRDVAVGCYYFGEPRYSCEVLKKSNRNRHIFYSL